MADAQLPEGFSEEISADYENETVQTALQALQQQPDHERLATFLLALREGLLVADVTGTSAKKKGTRARTIRSTQGALILPLFTSMAELRQAYPAGKREQAKGALMPAREALALLRTGPFAAVQFNTGGDAQIVLRKYIELVLADDAITAGKLEALR